MPNGEIEKHDGEIITFIRSLRKYSQTGAGKNMGISQQGFSKWEKISIIPEEKKHSILKALKSSPKEFEVVKNLLYPPPKNLNRDTLLPLLRRLLQTSIFVSKNCGYTVCNYARAGVITPVNYGAVMPGCF